MSEPIKRKPKPIDQENAEKALRLISELVKNHPEIDTNQWISACMSCCVASYYDSGISYEYYAKDMKEMVNFYRGYWEK